MTLEITIAEDAAASSVTREDSQLLASATWQRIGQGRDGEAFIGQDHARRLPAELRVLSGLAGDSARLDELARRLRLIELTKHPSIRPVLATDLQRDPPSIVISIPNTLDPRTSRLSDTLSKRSSSSRLNIAGCILDALSAAHRIGLIHGDLTADVILAGETDSAIGYCSIDFTGLNCWDARASRERSFENDLKATHALMTLLLQPLVNADSAYEGDGADPLLSNRDRNGLRQLMNVDPDSSWQEAPTLAQWTETLGKWLPQSDTNPTLDPIVSDDSEHTEMLDNDSTHNLSGGIDSLDFHSPVLRSEVPDQLGRFKISERIGEGGMGTVYRGVDLADDRPVAVKVLRATQANIARAVRRFRKEARLLADSQNDHVTRLIEIGEDSGHHYLVMELVEGIDLKTWFDGKPYLDESSALELVGDIAKALVDAHSKEVIHRDIKPENVLLQFINNEATETQPKDRPLNDYRVKLTDFGIARHVHQSSSMEMTQAGMILGTPRYMAPEQFDSGDEIRPTADVYSLGITLYELLTGQPPFASKDLMTLATMHRHEAPVPVQKKRADISELTSQVVARALAKEPSKRYGDASQLLTAIQRVLRGESVSMQAHPKSPEHDETKVWDKTVTWELKSPPEKLWHYVSNTERLNHALGFPSVAYRTEKDPELGLRKFGSFVMAGMQIAWEEHPFEWIEGKRMGILREFASGPFKWFLSVVTLDELPGGGTRLSHRVTIEPRNLVGRMLTTIEADWKGFRNLDRVYKRIDRSIQGKLEAGEGSDAFARTAPMSSHQQARLDERIEKVIDDGIEPRIAKKLGDAISQWASQEIAQIRPLQLADALAVEGPPMIDACLVAASRGLLQLRWDVLCPTCRAPATTSDKLSEIAAHTQCEACDVEFQSNVGNAIEMVFRVHPEIREVDDAHYCIGGPEHSPHVVAQLRIEPNERLELPMDLHSGDYLIRGPRLPRTQSMRVRDTGAPCNYESTLSTLGAGVHVPVLRRGQQTITLTNDLNSLQVVRIERMISRDDVVTATTAATLARFRQLFPNQAFDSDNPVATEDVTLLATAVNNMDDVYAKLGDSEAYSLTARMLALATSVIATEGGTVTKSMGEKLLAAFARREQAVRAALRLRNEWKVAPWNSLDIGIGVHSGPTLVTTENDRLDYFGSNVRAVISLAEKAGGDTLLTEPVYSDAEVGSFLAQTFDRGIETLTLPGIAETRVLRVGPN